MKQILVIQAGWVLMGNVMEVPRGFQVENAQVIERWGTTKGLGEIALCGPTSETVLRDCGTAIVPEASVLFRINCLV